MNAKTSTPSGFTAHDRRGSWFAVISGERRGAVAGLARGALAILAGLYRAGLAIHDVGLRLFRSAQRAAVPVISVGNLTVGGTGKTPMVAYLARLVTERGKRPVILSRGYGAAPGKPNEEALELERLCPGVPHVQRSDRFRALEEFAAQGPCDLAILDDGFQHRRLARDLDIVLIDATQPFGFGRVLPRGLLREPLSALHRADLVILTRADLVTADALANLKKELAARLRPGAPILVAAHRPAGMALADGSRREVAWLRDRAVAAACGIGNPDAFRRTLEQVGARVQRFEVFPDHYAYSAPDLDRLIQGAEAAGAKTLVTTGKDFVKWRPLLAVQTAPPAIDIAALTVELRLIEGEQDLRNRLTTLLH
jgi:tetraacyldisaccharide 4'-kinase